MLQLLNASFDENFEPFPVKFDTKAKISRLCLVICYFYNWKISKCSLSAISLMAEKLQKKERKKWTTSVLNTNQPCLKRGAELQGDHS